MEENQRDFKGVWFPKEIYLNTKVSWNAKILFLEINSFTRQGKACYFSNDYLAGFLGVSIRQVQNCLAELVQIGWIEQCGFDGRRRYLRSRHEISCMADMNKTSCLGRRKVHGRDEVFFTHNNTVNNTITNTPYIPQKGDMGVRADKQQELHENRDIPELTPKQKKFNALELLVFAAICKYFGFDFEPANELRYLHKWRLIEQFLLRVNAQGRLDDFTKQFEFYKKYKQAAREKIHRLENFLEEGWDDNWEKRYCDFIQQNSGENTKQVYVPPQKRLNSP